MVERQLAITASRRVVGGRGHAPGEKEIQCMGWEHSTKFFPKTGRAWRDSTNTCGIRANAPKCVRYPDIIYKLNIKAVRVHI